MNSLKYLVAIALLFTNVYRAEALREHLKKRYKSDANYYQIALDPERYTGRDKDRRLIRAVYVQYNKNLPEDYAEVMPKSFALMKIENMKAELPLLFSCYRGNSFEKIKELTPRKQVKIYGRISSKSYRGKDGRKDLYFMLVEDIEEVQPMNEVSDFKINDFMEVKPRRLEIQPAKFAGKKVRFDLSFSKLSNQVPAMVTKFDNINYEKHFVFIPKEQFILPLVINRENEYCVEPLTKVKVGGKLNVCGVLKSVRDETKELSRPFYYIYVYNLSLILE
jgi:hypothetical protein